VGKQLPIDINWDVLRKLPDENCVDVLFTDEEIYVIGYLNLSNNTFHLDEDDFLSPLDYLYN
jgi:hypothetical protein